MFLFRVFSLISDDRLLARQASAQVEGAVQVPGHGDVQCAVLPGLELLFAAVVLAEAADEQSVAAEVGARKLVVLLRHALGEARVDVRVAGDRGEPDRDVSPAL